MIRFRLLFIGLLFLFPHKLHSINISVVDIDSLINNNSYYINILKRIDDNQKEFIEDFKQTENKLDNLKKEIDESKIILNEVEINTMINNYNEELNIFTNLVENFNLHYQNEIIRIRKIIFEEIIVLIEKYAKNNNVDLVLDSTSYIMANNSINITNILQEELKNIKLKLDLKKFEKN